MNNSKIKKIIKNDTVILIIASIILPIIVAIMLGDNFSDSDVPFLVKSIVYIIWLVYVLTRKTDDRFHGITVLYISILMIIGNVFGRSVFELIFLLLSVFYLIHGIIYIKNTEIDRNKNHTLLIIMYVLQLIVFYFLFILK